MKMNKIGLTFYTLQCTECIGKNFYLAGAPKLKCVEDEGFWK